MVLAGDQPPVDHWRMYRYEIVSDSVRAVFYVNVSIDSSGCIVPVTTSMNGSTVHVDTWGYRFQARITGFEELRGDPGKLPFKPYSLEGLPTTICRRNLSIIPENPEEYLRFPYYLSPETVKQKNMIAYNTDEWSITATYDSSSGWLKSLEAESPVYNEEIHITISSGGRSNGSGDSPGLKYEILLAIAVVAGVSLAVLLLARGALAKK